MRPEPLATGLFETPARTERLQLLAYLLRNAAQPVYLRGPSGSGKTSAATLVAQAMDDVAGVVWLQAEQAGDLRSVFAGELARAGLPAEPWPQVLDDGPGARDWLVVVDGADRLDPVAAQELGRLPLARVRLLLLGEGGLDGAMAGPVQFLDLPPFSRGQAAEFLRAHAGPQAARVTDDLVAGLHRATDGQPGALLAALHEVLRHERAVASGPPPGRLRRHLAWGGGVVLALALAVVLLFQEPINDWLLGQPEPAAPRTVAPGAGGGGEIRREAGSLVPPVSPAQPSVPGPTAPGPDAVPADATDGIAQEPPAVSAADPGVDPLDAVLRDALAALEAGPPQQEPGTAAPAAAAPQESGGVAPAAVPPPRDAATARPDQLRPSAGVEPADPPVSAPARVAAPGPAPAPQPAASTPRSPPDQGAEVVDRSRPAAQAPVAAEPRPAVAATPPGGAAGPAAVVEADRRPSATGWLDSRGAERYTLQLVGARDRDAVERFVARHGIKAPYAIFERRLDGRPWYALVAGDYPDRAAALRAREALPAGIRAADVWPRTFGSIREMQRAP